VDSIGDDVVEGANAGTDTIKSYISYSLGANEEKLYLYGTAPIGKGNGLNNAIYGNDNDNTIYGYSGNDILNGGKGNDYMAGGSGYDYYVVDNAGDVVAENANAGIDTVSAYINYTLASNVENLYLRGTVANGTGNVLNNAIYGNNYANKISGLGGNDILDGGSGKDTINGGNGNDILYGGAGNDTLNGGAGQDRFVFSESGSANWDNISYFSHADDTIILSDMIDGAPNAVIKGLSFTGGVLNAGSYSEGAGYTGNGAEESGIYNDTANGNIWYNPTSYVVGDSVLICTVGVSNATSLNNTDFAYSA